MTGPQFPTDQPTQHPDWARLTPLEKADKVRPLIEQDHVTYSEAAALLHTSRVAVAGVVERAKRRGQPIVSHNMSGWSAVKGGGARKGQKGGQKSLVTRKAKAARKKKTYAPPQKTTRKSGFNVMAEYLTHNADPTPYRADLWEVLPGAVPVAVAEHHEGCRFPHGDGPFTFCALPVKPGSSYCLEHDTICYRGSLHTTPKQLLAPVRRTGVNMTASVDADFG